MQEAPRPVNNNRSYFFEKFKMWSGVVLFAYVATHLLNHSLGMISLDVMEQGRLIFVGFWRSPLLGWVALGALAMHLVLAFIKTVRRKSFRGLTGKEWAQIITGLVAPLYLIYHIMFTRVAHETYGLEITYHFYMLGIGLDVLITALIAIVLLWWHGVIGIDSVLSEKRWYPDWRPRLKAIAIVLPFVAIAGTVSAYQQAKVRALHDPTFATQVYDGLLAQGLSREDFEAATNALGDQLAGAYFALLAGILLLRAGILWYRRRRHPVSVQYPDGREVYITPGTSVLEASLMGRIPHAHLCGGRGRCSTCRVRIYEGCDRLAPPSTIEQRVLRQIGAADNIRLACQTFPQSDCRVYPILPADTHLRGFADKRFLQGADRKIAILFADLRGFTSFSEHRLPFDVVFVLNQYFQAVGRAVEARGGYLDKFIGDGAMALFGIDVDLKTACRQAIEAAWEMGRELESLNVRLASELPESLKIGIGLHCGDVIVGKMGYKHTSQLTAIGDAVNTAARLEAMTKEFGAQLLISAEVASHAGLDLSGFASTEVPIRGKSSGMQAFVVPEVQNLPIQALQVGSKPIAEVAV